MRHLFHEEASNASGKTVVTPGVIRYLTSSSLEDMQMLTAANRCRCKKLLFELPHHHISLNGLSDYHFILRDIQPFMKFRKCD